MRHCATALRALAGVACAALLASCAPQAPAPTTAEEKPAVQFAEVKDRPAEEEPVEGADAAAEGAAFDASAPVTETTSALGVALTAPEGFSETAEYAAVEAEISALVSAGRSVSVRMVDLETGRGLSYNADVGRYPASSIKALFCAAVCEALGGSAGMAQAMASCLIDSSNEAYELLIDTFGLTTFAEWLGACGATGAVDEAWTHFYPNISASELADAWSEIWRYGTSGEPGADELVGYLSQTASTPMGQLLRGEHEVWSKAGWYPADGNGLTSTNDAGVVVSDDGPYVLVVMTDLSADLDGLEPLIAALDAAHDAMCGGAA